MIQAVILINHLTDGCNGVKEYIVHSVLEGSFFIGDTVVSAQSFFPDVFSILSVADNLGENRYIKIMCYCRKI